MAKGNSKEIKLMRAFDHILEAIKQTQSALGPATSALLAEERALGEVRKALDEARKEKI